MPFVTRAIAAASGGHPVGLRGLSSLSDAVDAEIKSCESVYDMSKQLTDVDGGSSVPDGFQLEDDPSEMVLELTRQNGDEEIAILVDANELKEEHADFDEGEDYGDEADEDGGDEEDAYDDDGYSVDVVPFSVGITKVTPAGPRTLQFECKSHTEFFEIIRVRLATPPQPLMEEESDMDAQDLAAAMTMQDVEEQMRVPYEGVNFEHLGSDLQQALFDYLEARGVDDAMAEFLIHISIDKMQRAHLDVLSDLRDFLKPGGE